MTKPHGGRLINRLASDAEAENLGRNAQKMTRVPLNQRELADLEMIAIGAMSPLEGFMCQNDYLSVLASTRLVNGLVWTLPVVLSAKTADHESLRPGAEVALTDEQDRVLAVMEVADCYRVDQEYEAKMALGATDEGHPGVQYLNSVRPAYLGGKVRVLRLPEHLDFVQYRLTPKETRVLFAARGWRRIAAFQTRNPIHRAHEYLQKCALEVTDGLLIHPLVGETKSDDIPADVRMRCYEQLIAHYYPKERVVMSVFPAAMRYAGPREAIFHALVRKNYGCTHFIVGRDHAGVGNYYGTYDAQRIFENYTHEELGMTPLFFEHAFYCRACGGMATPKTCPHRAEERLSLSGTRVREMLARGEPLPEEFTRPEVADVLMSDTRKEAER